MKKGGIIAIVFCAILLFPLWSEAIYQSPGKPQGFVSDFAGLLTAESKNALEQKLTAFKNESSFEISVATISFLEGESIEIYSIQLAREWGIGQKGKNTGVLVLIAPNDRQARIEVGYGLEGALTDAQASAIVRNIMIPVFAKGNYEKGIIDGVDAVIGVVRGEIDSSLIGNDKSNSILWNFFRDIGGQAIFVIFLVIISVLASTKSWWLGGVFGLVAGIIIGIFTGLLIGIIYTIVLAALGLLIDYVVSKRGGGGPGGRGGFWGGFGGGSMGGG
ncbi:MAG: TPM domain-containing protein, partial [Patescibacteria group bacterium]